MDAHVPDLLLSASPLDLLRLASRAACGLGADMATSHWSDGTSSLQLVGHDGFGNELCEHVAVVDGAATPYGRAAHERRPLTVPDVASHPLLAGTDTGAVLLRAGVRSFVVVPLVATDGELLGVLSAYWRTPGARAPDVLAPLAAEVAGRLAGARRGPTAGRGLPPAAEADLLRQALASRTVIAQAQGILIARDGLTPVEAFDVLRRASQRTNRKLRELAAGLVAQAAPARRTAEPRGREVQPER